MNRARATNSLSELVRPRYRGFVLSGDRVRGSRCLLTQTPFVEYQGMRPFGMFGHAGRNATRGDRPRCALLRHSVRSEAVSQSSRSRHSFRDSVGRQPCLDSVIGQSQAYNLPPRQWAAYTATLAVTAVPIAASGGVFQWQNSTMLIVLRHADGERLWSADYNYKGGWEFSGWVVNTPEEVARLVAKRLKNRFANDMKHKR